MMDCPSMKSHCTQLKHLGSNNWNFFSGSLHLELASVEAFLVNSFSSHGLSSVGLKGETWKKNYRKLLLRQQALQEQARAAQPLLHVEEALKSFPTGAETVPFLLHQWYHWCPGKQLPHHPIHSISWATEKQLNWPSVCFLPTPLQLSYASTAQHQLQESFLFKSFAAIRSGLLPKLWKHRVALGA